MLFCPICGEPVAHIPAMTEYSADDDFWSNGYFCENCNNVFQTLETFRELSVEKKPFDFVEENLKTANYEEVLICE